jgi:hypothetical protein
MDCENVGEFLKRYSAGGASFSKDAGVLEHVKTCKACKDAVQKVLLEADATLFQNALLVNKPAKGFVDAVLESLPESKKPAKTTSSGRLRAHRGKRKSPSSGQLKPVRPARARATVRRRRRDDSTVAFFGGEIFQSTEKKTSGGFTIIYCDDCNERINPSDIEDGSAASYKGVTYCPRCKVKIAGLMEAEEEKKEVVAASAPARPRPRPARPPRGGATTAKPMNMPLIGGAIAGVALILLVVVLVFLNSSGSPPVSSPAPNESSIDTANLDPESPTVMEGAGDDGGAGLGVEAVSGISEQEAYERKLLEKKRLEEEKQKKKIEVLEKMLADTQEKSDELRGAKKYPEAIQLWIDIIEKFTEKKEFHRPKDLEQAQSQLQSTRRYWLITAEKRIDSIVERSEQLMYERKWDEALKVLDSFPEEWKSLPSIEVKLRAFDRQRDIVKYRKEKLAAQEARAAISKALRTLEIGKTYDAFPDKNHVLAEWAGRGKVGFDDKEKIVSITTISGDSPSYLMCRYKNHTKFEDYVLEFEYKAAQGMGLFFRMQGNKQPRLGLPPASSFMKVKFVVEGISAYIEINGKRPWESVVDLNPGYFGFMAIKAGTVKIKNLKVTITK